MKEYVRAATRSVVYALLALALLTGTNPALAAASSNDNADRTALPEVYSADSFLALTNAVRVSVGLAPLAHNAQLDDAAYAKAADMVKNGYWDHFRPSDHKAPWDFIDQAGYRYQVAGENLARGFETPEGITRAWLLSPSHRANLLSPAYRDMGLACVRLYRADGSSYLVTVQMFGARE